MSTAPSSRSGRDERGTITIFVLGLCIAVLFLGGSVVDFWRVIAVRRELSAMADAAATAGANGLDQTSLRTGGAALDPAQAKSLALSELRQEAQSGIIRQVAIDADTGQVVVRLHARVHFTLLGLLLGARDFDVGATATAHPVRSG